MLRKLHRYVRCYLMLIFLFSFGLTMAYLIPNSALEPQYSKSIAQLEKEDRYPNYLFNADGAILDNFMDGIMIRTCKISDRHENVIKAAFDSEYPRYWNGYLLLLRPVLSQFSYQQIRYINMFLLITLFCFCFSGIQTKINSAAAIVFAISIIACYFVFVGASLQYFSVFAIMFAAIILLLYTPLFSTGHRISLLFFSVGMITNYFDLLTAPLLTLGMPLIVVFCLKSSENGKKIFEIITHSISWSIGYGICWLSKWAISTIVLGENIFRDALTTAQFRISGNEQYPLDRLKMFELNFNTYFFSKGHKPAIIIFIFLLLLLLILIRHHKNNWHKIFFPIALIGLMPYVWFFAFANHSQMHYFYTYRIQAITLFAISAAVSTAINWKSFAWHIRRFRFRVQTK